MGREELGAVLEENAARPDAEVERDDGDDEEEMADLDAVVGGGDPIRRRSMSVR